MNPPDYTPSEHLTPVKGASSPADTSSEIITPIKSLPPVEYHYPTPPDSKPKAKVAPGNLRIDTRLAMPEDMWAKGPQRTLTKSEDSLSVQERRALKSYGMYIDAYNSYQLEDADSVEAWTTNVESVAEPELVVAMNPFYDEYEDGNYYAWLNDEYYEGDMPEIVRRANAFRGFPQLDEELYNPQGWEEKHTYYRSPTGIRDMEPYLASIEREQGLLDPELCEDDSMSVEEANRENIEAFQKTWANTLGVVDEPTSTTLWVSSTEALATTPEMLPADSRKSASKTPASPAFHTEPTSATALGASSIETPTATPKDSSTDSNTFSSKTPASPAVGTESTSVSLAARPIFTAAKADGSHVLRIKSAAVLERAASHTAGSSSNAAAAAKTKKKKNKSKKRRRHRKDGAYKPGRDDSEDESNNDRPRKRGKKSER